MNKKTKNILIALTALLVVVLIGIVLVNIFKDENSLSVEEKKYLDNNSSKVFDVIVPNDLSIFGNEGKGVFFDYLDYIRENININVNNHTVSYTTDTEGYGFYISTEYKSDELMVYKDHFVLVSQLTGLLNNYELDKLEVGVLSKDKDYIASYYDITGETLKTYDTYKDVTTAMNEGTIKYAIVPLNEYKSELIANGINILSHISDLNKYYYFRLADNEKLNSIYTKTIHKFMKSEFDKSYNNNNYDLFISELGITGANEDTLTNKVFKYGFVENLPYEILTGGEYGGITAQYIQLFQEFSGVEFTYQKYNNAAKLTESVMSKKVDLFYNYYTLETGFTDSGALGAINYYVVADNSIDLSMSNIHGLKYKEVYVQENSYLYELIKDIEGIKIKTFSTTSDLKNIVKKKSIIVVDQNTVTYYLTQITNNYSVRYTGSINNQYYSFKYVDSSDTFYKLFNSFTKTIDPNDLVRKGITTYNTVNTGGNILKVIATIILSVIGVSVISGFMYKRQKKKLKINTKVRKEDRIKYIDMLTSLKNRNYLNDQMPLWNKNKIYPQACIVFDINKLKELNDSSGYEEGDKLIQEVANILVKNQVDNSELMRTDGNEFMVYLVGYSEKQVLTYIKKITKNFSKLSYEPGVAIGYSLVEDNTKLVEDAFNEASIKMRENKDIEGDHNANKD